MQKPFVITKVSWLTQTVGMENERASIINDHFHITKFLQDHGLVVRTLMHNIDDITDDFTLSSDDLTAEGLALMKAAYHKWLTKIDNGMSPTDTSMLKKALQKIRDNI